MPFDDSLHLYHCIACGCGCGCGFARVKVADSNSSRLEWIVIWLISVEIVMGIISNPLFAGKKMITACLVPLSIIAYKKIDWSVIDFD
jgi:hypothetical protein